MMKWIIHNLIFIKAGQNISKEARRKSNTNRKSIIKTKQIKPTMTNKQCKIHKIFNKLINKGTNKNKFNIWKSAQTKIKCNFNNKTFKITNMNKINLNKIIQIIQKIIQKFNIMKIKFVIKI